MKKRIFTLAVILALFVCSAACLASCDMAFNHTYSSELSYDGTYHFYSCTGDGCDSRIDIQPHTLETACVEKDGKTYVGEACTVCDYEKITTDILVASDSESLESALADGGEIIIYNDIEVTESIEIPQGVTVTLNLNGKTLTGTVGRDADNNRVHTLVNNGTLTLVGGTVTSAGANGGSAIYNAAGATLTINGTAINGAPKADGSWPSYGVNNYGTMTVNDATVKTYHGGIATNDGGVTVINNASIDVGQNTATGITSYTLYTYGSAKLTVYGGTFANTASDATATGGAIACEGGDNAIVIEGGSFSGGCGLYGSYVISGGTFDRDVSTHVADGYKAIAADGIYYVVEDTIDAVVADSTALESVIENGGTAVLVSDTELTKAISNDLTLDLNGNELTVNSMRELKGGSNLTITDGAYTSEACFGHIDVRPGEGETSKVVFENVDFTRAYDGPTYGNSYNAVETVMEFCATATGGKIEVEFINCTFNNAKVLFEGLSGTVGEFEATFDGCTFNLLGNTGAIQVDNNVAGTITVKDCEFNVTATSNVSVISTRNGQAITINLENNTVNGEVADADLYKVFTTQSVTFVSAGASTTVIGLDTTTYNGIAK